MIIIADTRTEFTAMIEELVREGRRFRAEATSEHTYTITLTGEF